MDEDFIPPILDSISVDPSNADLQWTCINADPIEIRKDFWLWTKQVCSTTGELNVTTTGSFTVVATGTPQVTNGFTWGETLLITLVILIIIGKVFAWCADHFIPYEL